MSENHPMRPIEFLVLATLAEGELHGYGIVQRIEARTGGRVRPKPGNLYRVLDRLLERGLLVEVDGRSADELDDERRRYYGITDAGRTALREEASLLGTVVERVRDTLPDTTG